MVRETRHLWVGNLPENIREDRIREHFKRYGRVQSIKLLPRSAKEETGENTMACTVAFMDIKSASKAHTAEHKIDDRTLTTEYYEPAAIPSAASPQNTNSTYSTSPGSTRFPNSHGSAEEHGNFNERFYERSNSRVAEGEYIRRAGYHDNRGRNRDRGYRNGPSYNNVIDRHRTLNSSWSYDSSRYNNETGYGTTPSDTNDRRSSDSQSTKNKKTKSRSGSRSPSPSGSTSSRSPSRSRSRSSSSSSSSSTSRASSSTSSPQSRRIASSVNNPHQPVVHSDDRRPLAICVRNLPLRSSDTSLKDGLFHEYKKHGKVTWVKIVGQGSERHAIVCFKKPEDVDKALEVSYDKLFFGCKIEVAPYQGYDVDDNELRPYEAEIDEFHPKATRTLFIGNLEKDVTASDLRKHFDQFGEIIEIDIKKQGAVSSYAFCQYSDIVSVVKAIRAMDGEHLGNNRIKLGFGKSMPTTCVWVDGVVESVNEKYLTMQFDPFGSITQMSVNREKGQALILYEQVINAQTAVNKMRGFNLRGRKIQVDFASRECQEAFYEHLEKQGHVTDRAVFEERRDAATARTFEAAAITTATRFSSRYDTPSRPRTSSYSSRSSATASQCNASSAIPSPSTPGSVTPRGSGSRSRLARYAEYYDPTTVDYADRRYRSYDEFSQGSAASHEDGYEHEYAYMRGESPSHIDSLDSRSLQHGSDHSGLPFAPPDIRNLQKERVHLLEQLEECPSSGDELISPKKRLKLDLLDGTMPSDVIIEANRDHRKVMEVRRTSDSSLKHHSRRPSSDSKHGTRDIAPDRTLYLPHAVCKRRKTAGSDSSSRVPHHDLSGSESIGSSRPGTPLCDEKPENFPPSEPRRQPRDRDGLRDTPRDPLTLPLPKFAAQVMGKGSVSVAGIKGQKDNVLASPPPAATSPRISNPVAPCPAQVPPPASPPPRPPSLSSNSSDSDIAPPSPSLDERIRSLDEKYEKWSGSRALSAAGGDALAKLDATASERFRFRHKLLDLDLKEVQPSEIVKSVMAKRSVFDEDTKRLENVGEKYEPREFSPFIKTAAPTVQATTPGTPTSAPPVLKVTTTTQLPKTPTMLSPRSSGTNIIPAKGLQYPFPSHPPIQQQPAPPSSPAPTTPVLTSTTSTTIRGVHGDNRLKSCATASSSDNRTACKVSVNRTPSTVVMANLTQVKISDSTNKNCVNIPINCSDNATLNVNTSVVDVNAKHKGARDSKSSDKISDKVMNRRDSASSNGSPKSDFKIRKNSDSSTQRNDCSDKQSEVCDSSSVNDRISEEQEKNEERKERLEKERIENERLEKERLEKERVEKEKMERERIEKERLEKERLEKEKADKERIEREKVEKERLERERLEKERQEKERLERERLEKERLERERIEKERLEKEQLEREQRKREREERERKEKEEKERREREEQERLETERRERREKEEREKREREEREKREKQEQEKERIEKERLEKENERKRDDERKHKDDNHDKRKDDYSKHREIHSEIKHKENITETLRNDKHHDGKNTKENRIKDNQELFLKDSQESRSTKENKNSHDNVHNNEIRREDSKSKHHLERDAERRKESAKENRENNLHEKLANIVIEVKENNKPPLESRHFSIELEKLKLDPNRRKERNNSLPASVGSKRRMSFQESVDMVDEVKKLKLSQEHRKLSERRDSKDSRGEDKPKNKHKNNIAKIIEDKMRQDKHNNVKEISSDDKRKEKDRDKEKEERHKHKQQKAERQKSKDKIREKESPTLTKTSSKELPAEKDYTKLEIRISTDETEKQKQLRKEVKEKRKLEITDVESERKLEELKKANDRKREKRASSERRSREESTPLSQNEDRKVIKKERVRKATNNSSDTTDSDEPKKQHSIFEIVADEPAYISMYDKVKARSCKNMQKQEEEKRQEKLKAKFNQLKQSRAKREEKKRSTSWDEDSDSDHERRERSLNKCDSNKARRGNKMLITSSDDDEQGECKQRKKRDTYTDSDTEKHIHIKSEQFETSEDEHKHKSVQRKNSKSRITSDTSEDEFKRVQNKIKSEIFSDNDMEHAFTDLDEKPCKKIKDEDKYFKKEKKLKHQELTVEQVNAQIFGESPLPEIKVEDKSDSGRFYGDISSAEENHENKKEKSETRKKHKKKQKRQKHSISSEDTSTFDITMDSKDEDQQKTKNPEKKKQHSKKDKKKDKIKDDDKHKDKSKKSKRSKSISVKDEIKRDGKIENIFGSFSDDSENGLKDIESNDHTQNTYLDKLQASSVYASDSNSISHIEKEMYKSEEKDRKEEHRKRKEKKRREKEKRLREEELNDNSMDFADLGKQLEDNIKDDNSEALEETLANIKNEIGDRVENNVDIFQFTEGDDAQEIKKDPDRKEVKEKKKKRKKSKDEKHKHHHHHHDKNKLKSPEIKKDFILPAEDVKVEIEKLVMQSPSLPSLLDLPSPPQNKSVDVSSTSQESTVSQIPKTSKDKKREKFIPGFGSEIDEKVHETAVKSISEFETTKAPETAKEIKEEDLKNDKSENNDDKPRVVISQEETEDAVAALLGESFGGNDYEDCYDDQQPSLVIEQDSSVQEENTAEDLEEMQKAVQSLNSGDMELKPDTPQSEHELQIDTDTEEQEEINLRYEQSPRTPDMVDLSHPPKTPDIPSYFRTEEQVKATVVIKPSTLSGPPSLTPIKPQPVVTNLKRNTDTDTPQSTSVITEQPPRTVIAQPRFSTETKETDVSKLEMSVKHAHTTPVLLKTVTQTTTASSQPQIYSTPKLEKIDNSLPLSLSPKQPIQAPQNIKSDVLQKIQPGLILESVRPPITVASNSLPVHNLPVRMQYTTSATQHKIPAPVFSAPGVQPPRVSTVNVPTNRLPITPVMVPKPIQSTTVVLPQSKVAHATLNQPTVVDRLQERPRLVYQASPSAIPYPGAIHGQPRMAIPQTNMRGSAPQGLVVPIRHPAPTNYAYLGSTVTPSPTVAKDLSPSEPSRLPSITEPPKLVPTSYPAPYMHSVTQNSVLPQPLQIHHTTVISTTSNAKPLTATVNINKPFMPVIQETAKLVSFSTSNIELHTQPGTIIQSTTKQPLVGQPKESQLQEVKASDSKATEEKVKIEPKSPLPKPAVVETTKESVIKTETSNNTVIKTEPSEPKPQLAIEQVTEELNLSLKKEEPNVEAEAKQDVKDSKPSTDVTEAPKHQINETVINKLETNVVKTEPEISASVQDVDKVEEEKVETESLTSDKERFSAEMLCKDDGMDSKEDSDYWSAKEVNIDSVIKKVDALCSADELSDRSSEIGKDDWLDNEHKQEGAVKDEDKVNCKLEDTSKTENQDSVDENAETVDDKLGVSRGGRRGGRARGGRKTRSMDRAPGVQTRRGKIVKEIPVKRGARGGVVGARVKNERKPSKSESETADVYEFRDDSDENIANKDRPRLILTIKSPVVVAPCNTNPQTTVVKEVPKEPTPTKPQPVTENKDDFVSPAANTRKSRRLQERDVCRNTVDDTIEDVVRNAVVTRSATAVVQPPQTRRSARQTATKPVQETPRKSPRATKGKKDRRASDATEDSSEEKPVKTETSVKTQPEVSKEPVAVEKEVAKEVAKEEKVEPPKEKPHEGLKAAVLRRVKGEMNQQEPMTLIDPVTGLLMPMRECEEGRYIPVAGALNQLQRPPIENQLLVKEPNVVKQVPEPPMPVVSVPKPVEPQPKSVITTPQPPVVVQQKPPTLKAHVLSSQAARAAVTQQTQPPKPITVTQTVPQQTFVVKPNVGVGQNLNINVSVPNLVPAHLSPRPSLPPTITKPLHIIPSTKLPQHPPMSPNQMVLTNTPKQQHILQVTKPSPALIKAQTNPIVAQQQLVNTQVAHVKHQQPQMVKPVVINKTQRVKPYGLHPQQQILTGAVASPPLKQAHHHSQLGPNRVVQLSASVPSTGAKSATDPPKVDVSMAGCVIVPHSSASPQGQPRHVLQAGLPLPAYEASLGEAIAHFPPGSVVPLRPPHDIPPAHYMHSHVMYQQYLRQSYHIPRSPLIPGSMEKTGDGQEGEEAPVTSPPLELRRPGSVGLALSGRSTVPHSLQSPHDRTTDSPQIGQVYNVHGARMQHYHPSRYYDQAAEPPPAHRQLTSHASLAALGSDRALSHMGLATPDRPLSSHIPPERPLSTHSALAGGHLGNPERPLSTHLPDRSLPSHGLTLGAAGNLMGAVARHGAEAPASQRGLQAATPPHASQVPPQAESLLMLLKQYPCMWQGLLALKNDQAAVQMYFVSGNNQVAKCSLPKNTDGSTPPLRIFQRMRLEPPQVEGVARKMQMENEHCMLLALPCGHDHMDVLKQSTNLTNGFITYLQQKQAAGIVNVAAPGTTQPPAYVVHIFPSCDFVNENLRRIAPSLLERVADIAHLLIVITTV